MATILIVDDHVTDRQMLTSLLGYVGHSLLESSSAEIGLELARKEQPALIISDILMPTMNGYEFVRQLRSETITAQIPVIFYSANFLEGDARILAEACGVSQILTKPVDPEIILETVNKILGNTEPYLPRVIATEEFQQQQLQLLNSTLTEKLDVAIPRLAALIELGQQLAQEDDPAQMLLNFSGAAQTILSAQSAGIAIVTPDGQGLSHLYINGASAEVCTQHNFPSMTEALLDTLLSQEGVFQGSILGTRPLGMIFDLEPTATYPFLGVPVNSSAQRYGWLLFMGDVDARQFDEEEEQLAITLASQIAIAYENAERQFELQQEIARRKLLEETLQETLKELSRSNEELKQFAYVASHDLKAPLSLIIGYLDLLKDEWADNAPVSTLLIHAIKGSSRMLSLIEDLLTYSEAGKGNRPPEVVNTELALSTALENLTVAINKTGAIVTHDILPPIMANEIPLMQVFQNLIGNAIKFCTRETPKIHISAQQSGREWVFGIHDNGIGIAPENLEKIFAAFNRLHGIKDYPGNGIGLATCKKIVERYGGQISLESQIGEGTTFYFNLPSGSRVYPG